MHVKQMVVTLISAATLSAASGFALAQQPSAKPAPGSEKGSMEHHGMMGGSGMGGGDMMGMMNMMQGCQQMMGGGMSGRHAMPRMPAGNEKLEFQMHAEMMQKMGEIAAKYASQIKEGPRAMR